MPMPAYFDRYPNLRMTREDGILEVVMHSDGGPILFSGQAHHEFVDAFYDIGRDRDNRVVLFTGTGDTWIESIDPSSIDDITRPRVWEEIRRDGIRSLQNLLEIDVPILCVVNGPARIHSEWVLIADIVLAAPHAVFQDRHLLDGPIAATDGAHVLWPLVLGPTRGRYFLLTQEELDAQEALRLGVVNEVHASEALMPRARTLARELAAYPDLTLRYMRVGLVERLKRELHAGLGVGLALEGLSAAALAEAGDVDANERAD
jgi:enoyl-CoA hydratase/carnithine racemase